MHSWFARIALLVGNFVTGTAIMGLAGMLLQLADGLGVSIGAAGLLVTFGAIVLCIGAPLMVWVTSRFDRRSVLVVALFAVAIGHVVSAFAPNYVWVLALRLVTMAFAALLTPVAAGTVALIVAERERSSAIAFVFLGFSLAMAVGLPIVTFVAAHAGWQITFAVIGAAAAVSALLLYFALPRGLYGEVIAPRSWGALMHNRLVVLLLLLTCVQVSGQFIVFTYLAPLLTRLAGASVAVIGTLFSIFGIAGVVGNVIATRLVRTLQAWATSLAALTSILFGFALWSFGAGTLAIMGTGIVFWGLGFAAINSMQQARLVAAAPALASAAVALNTSAIYTGQAVGSALGGTLFAHDLPQVLGYAAMVFAAAAIALLMLTRPPKLGGLSANILAKIFSIQKSRSERTTSTGAVIEDTLRLLCHRLP